MANKRLMGLLVLSTLAASSWAQTTLWKTCVDKHEFYRIPAIVAWDDHIVAFSDNRSGVTDATVWGDIGSEGNISIEARHSDNDGITWSPARNVVMGFGRGTFDQGHGDAAVVRDHDTGRMLLLCASGSRGFGRSEARLEDHYATALQVGRYYSVDDGYTWNGANITPQIYGLYVKEGQQMVKRLFFTSGRILQSQIVKSGRYHRIYSALASDVGSLVVYSDDFGQNWLPLGGSDARPAPDGNEAKVEELPDGSIVLSCRRSGKPGRYFNIFTYADARYEQGRWAEPVTSTDEASGTATLNNDCNGEILVVPAIGSEGRPVYVALQSVPRGSHGTHPTNLERRSHVGIYWKVFDTPRAYRQPTAWVDGWQHTQVTDGHSAYSSMVLDGNGNICFIYEDHGVHFRLGSQGTEMYDILFRRYTLSEITHGAYTFGGDATHRHRFLKRK